MIVFISYDDILDVDEVGDNVLKIPTVFVNFRDKVPPFSKTAELEIESPDRFQIRLNGDRHVKIFPDQFRDISWETDWFSRNNISYSTELRVVPLSDRLDIPDN